MPINGTLIQLASNRKLIFNQTKIIDHVSGSKGPTSSESVPINR